MLSPALNPKKKRTCQIGRSILPNVQGGPTVQRMEEDIVAGLMTTRSAEAQLLSSCWILLLSICLVSLQQLLFINQNNPHVMIFPFMNYSIVNNHISMWVKCFCTHPLPQSLVCFIEHVFLDKKSFFSELMNGGVKAHVMDCEEEYVPYVGDWSVDLPCSESTKKKDNYGIKLGFRPTP